MDGHRCLSCSSNGYASQHACGRLLSMLDGVCWCSCEDSIIVLNVLIISAAAREKRRVPHGQLIRILCTEQRTNCGASHLCASGVTSAARTASLLLRRRRYDSERQCVIRSFA